MRFALLVPKAGMVAGVVTMFVACQARSSPGSRSGVAQQAEYADPQTCAACHARIAETYRRTGMARAFYRPRPENTVEGVAQFYHPASGTYFRILQRDGKFYQRRWQTGADGAETNVEELQIDYVMGSGNHVRTYLHRTVRGALIELPLAWYAEQAGPGR